MTGRERDIAIMHPEENRGGDSFQYPIDAVLPHLRDSQGRVVYPEEIDTTLSTLNALGIERRYYPTLLPFVLTFGHMQNINFSSSDEIAKAVMLVCMAQNIDIPHDPFRRRAFLKGMLIAGGLLSLAGMGGLTAQQVRYDACRDKSEFGQEVVTDKMNKEAFDYLGGFIKQADFLIGGGYIEEWDTSNIHTFLHQAAEEARGVVVGAFNQLMDRNDIADLVGNIYLATDDDEFKKFSGSNNTSKVAGIHILTIDGNERIILHLGNLASQLQSRFDAKDFGWCVYAICDILVHELSHYIFIAQLPDDVKRKIKTFLNASLSPGEVVTDIETNSLTFEIDYHTKTNAAETKFVFGNAVRNGNKVTSAFGEAMRELIQRGFYKRLDKHMDRPTNRKYDTYYSYYASYKLLDYFHHKIGVEDDEVLDILNEYYNKKGKGNIHTVMDLIRFYQQSAQKKGLTITEEKIFLVLQTIEAESQKIVADYEEFYDHTPSAIRVWLDANLMCDIEDFSNDGKKRIDDKLQ